MEDAEKMDPTALHYYHKYYAGSVTLNPTPIDVSKPQTMEDAKSLLTEILVKSLAGEMDENAADRAVSKLATFANMLVGNDLTAIQDAIRAAMVKKRAEKGGPK